MRTLAVEASQEKRRISRCKATAADPELKVSNGEGGGGGVLRFVSLSLVLLISRVVPPPLDLPLQPPSTCMNLNHFQGN